MATPRPSTTSHANPSDDRDRTPMAFPGTTRKRRRNLIPASPGDADRRVAPSPADGSPAPSENGRGFAGRYGPVLAAANFNVWPHALLLEADDGVPHWRRIGLDRAEVFFLMIVLSHYFARGDWPAVSIERLAGWLDLTERRVQQLKNALIDDGYLIRVTRHDRDGNRRPDALDCSPLFALLEACLLRYHPNLITRDAAPVWIAPGPALQPLDPDDFGNRRRERARRASSSESTGRPVHKQRTFSVLTGPHPALDKGKFGGMPPNPLPETTPTADGPATRAVLLPANLAVAPRASGEAVFGEVVNSISSRPVQPASSVGETRLHHAEETGCTGSDPIQRGDRSFNSAEPAIQSEDETHRALAAPGASPPHLENVGGTPKSRELPFNGRLTAVVTQHALRFRDNDLERSIATAHHLWWNAHLPLRTFVALLDRAAMVTSQTISRGQIRHGEPGARQAMPYYFRMVETFCEEAIRSEA